MEVFKVPWETCGSHGGGPSLQGVIGIVKVFIWIIGVAKVFIWVISVVKVFIEVIEVDYDLVEGMIEVL